jgi:hypothetical protein
MSDDAIIVGRIVHYVTDPAECTAAIVTRVFHEEADTALGTVSVTTFAWADGVDMATAYECQEKTIPGTWHWPQGCPRG